MGFGMTVVGTKDNTHIDYINFIAIYKAQTIPNSVYTHLTLVALKMIGKNEL